jgi:hypothetical protein
MNATVPTTDQSLRGTSLIEVMITVTLFTVVLISSMAMVQSGRRFSSTTIGISAAEEFAQQMLFRIEHELSNATGLELNAVITADFPAGETDSLQVDSTLGFPPRGRILIERGGGSEERVEYTILDPDQVSLRGLTRGIHCTEDTTHLDKAELMWTGLAEPLESQQNPPPGGFDGIADEGGVPVFFRGDGTGFSYRVPIDPANDGNYLNGADLFWGAEIQGTKNLDGYLALYFEAKMVLDEAETGDDVNRDGDSTDVFDIGQIRRVTWDATDPTGPTEDVGLGPTVILQERCNRGGDLDGDGFDDPIFLWDKDSNQLHIRLFVLGRAMREMPIVRKVESTMFLRNEPEI